MNARPVFHLISYIIIMSAVAMGLSILVSYIYKDPIEITQGLSLATVATVTIGLVLMFLTRGPIDLSRRDGFGIVVFGWLSVCLVGCLPYLLTHTVSHPVDAFFETMSGFTTTGASILTEITGLPKGVLFYRALTQWLGGMGVLLLCIAILPFLGVGGMQIYRAEMPGPSKDRLTPRIASTAKLLWVVYLTLTLIQTALLKLAGMSIFDALCHSFCTLATAGFSTQTASVGAYDSKAIQWIFIVFMFLGGMNFSLHFKAMRGDIKSYFRSPECKIYMLITLIAGLLVSANLFGQKYDHGTDALTHGFFQSVSLLTGTGFTNADYDTWDINSKAILFVSMFLGGCAGSTTGGLKTIRIYVVFKELFRQIRLFMQPHAVLKVKMAGKSIDYGVINSISALVLAFILTFAAGTLVMSLWTDDLLTAASCSIASLGNIGPGFGAVGPSHNYAHLPSAAKLFLSFLMLLGRLELFSVFVVLNKNFWKK